MRSIDCDMSVTMNQNSGHWPIATMTLFWTIRSPINRSIIYEILDKNHPVRYQNSRVWSTVGLQYETKSTSVLFHLPAIDTIYSGSQRDENTCIHNKVEFLWSKNYNTCTSARGFGLQDWTTRRDTKSAHISITNYG